jgi:lysophospholipase L1-like esterase
MILALILAPSAAFAQALSEGGALGPSLPPPLPIAQENGGTGVDTPALVHWHACMAGVQAGAGSCTVVYIGDSTVYGWTGAAMTQQNVTYWLAHDLSAGGVNALNAGVCGVSNGSLGGSRYTYDTRFANNGWAESPWTTLGGEAFSAATASSGSTLVFTPGFAANTFSVVYPGTSTAGTYSVTATGGSAVTANSAQANALYTATATAPSLSAANTVTLDVTAPGAKALCVEAYNSGAASVNIINAGFGGSNVTQWVADTNPWDSLQTLQYLKPALTVIEAGLNEPGQGVSAATFTADLQQVIAAAQAVGDVVLVTGNPQATAAIHAPYMAAMRQLAAQDGIPVLSVDLRWGTQARAAATSPAMMNAGETVHPNAVGYADIAAALAKMLEQ